MTSRSRRRPRSLQYTMMTLMVIPVAVAGGGWVRLGEPFHQNGLYGFLVAGLLAGLVLPGLVVSARQMPQLLVPRRTLRWWRHRQAERGRGRPHIPAWLRRAVYAADGWQCRWCGCEDNLALDHIKPWAAGGLTALWNLMTLCSTCNKIKSNCWVWRSGYVSYRPFPGASDRQQALSILHWEKRHRWSPLRWIMAGWSIGW